MKNILCTLILMSFVACNADKKETVNDEAYFFHKSKAAPVTAVSQIEAVGIKDENNREINYEYKIFVDSSSSWEILLKKMYLLQRKSKLPFTRPLEFEKFGNYSYVVETDVSLLDKISNTIIGLKKLNPMGMLVIQNPCMLQGMPPQFISIEPHYFYCPLDTPMQSDKYPIAMMIESFPSKQKADSFLAIVKSVAKNAYIIKEPQRIVYTEN